MARSTGAQVDVTEKKESSYGVKPSGTFMPIPVVSIDLDEEEPLQEDDTLGQGRNQLDPALDQQTDVGNLVIPVDLRYIGRRLTGLLGSPVTTAQAATLLFTLLGQPTDGLTLIANGVTFTWKDTPGGGTDVQIGADEEESRDNMRVALNASADTDVDDATYSDVGTNQILATLDAAGPDGNAFTGGGTGVSVDANATGGAHVHTWKTGSTALPGWSIQIAHKAVDKPYELHRGVFHNTYAVAIDRTGGGLPQATFGLIAKAMDGPSASDLTGGKDTALAFDRFAKKHGFIEADAATLGNVQRVNLTYTNNGEAISTVRPDNEIDGVDPGVVNVRVSLSTRYGSVALFEKAIAGTPVDLSFGFIRNAGELLQHDIHRAFLSRPKKSVAGPGGVLAEFDVLGANDAGEACTMTVILKNDVAAY